MQWAGGQVCLLWFPMVFSLVYFDLFKLPSIAWQLVCCFRHYWQLIFKIFQLFSLK